MKHVNSQQLPREPVRNCKECSGFFLFLFWKTRSAQDYRSRLDKFVAQRTPYNGLFGLRYNYSALEIVIILTINYDVKQSQFTKSTLEPRACDPEESNEVFDHAIRG